MPLPWDVPEREQQPFTRAGVISGRDGVLLIAIVSRSPPLPSTLGEEGNAALCWFSSPAVSHFWRPGPLYSLH